MKNKAQRIVLRGHAAGIIDPTSFRHIAEYGNPEKFFGSLAQEQSDLFFVNCVLTEEGGNKNGLWFTQPLLIQKHASSRLKPFNFAHEFQNIIGVMYDSAIADETNRQVDMAKEISMQDGPDFHKLRGPYFAGDGLIRTNVAAALYSRIGKGEVANIIRKIEDGKEVAVSMECWVTHFDFYLMASDGTIEFADGPTNLHLLDYVNKEFAGKKVYKVPRPDGFLFGGIGQVDKGACPASVILAAAEERNSDEAEGNSAFDCLDHETVKQLVASLTEGATEEKAEKSEGEEKMSEVTKPGTPGDSTQGQKSGSVDVAALMNLHTQTSSDLGAAKADVDRLTKEGATKDQQIASLTTQVDEVKKIADQSVVSAQAETAKIKSEAHVASYLVKFYRDHNALASVAGSEEVLRHAFAAEGFSDEKFNQFVAGLKNRQDEKVKEQASLRRSVKCEVLGLPETASDDEIAKAEAAQKESAGRKAEDDTLPEKTGTEEGQAVRAVASAAQPDNKRTLVRPQGAVIEALNTTTQKVETITV